MEETLKNRNNSAFFIQILMAYLLVIVFSACQMSKKRLSKLKKETSIENPFEINELQEKKAEEDEKKKKEAFHDSGPSVAKKKTPEALKKKASKIAVKPKAKLLKEKSEKLAQSFPFKVGERIEYSVRFFALEAGRMTLEVKPIKEIKKRPVFHFYVSAKTSSIFAWVYSLKDFAESFWDMQSQRPFLMKIYGKESRYIREVQTSFNWAKKSARYQAKIFKIGKGMDEEDKTWKLKHMDAQDIVSALYYLRTKELKLGKVFNFRVAEKGKDILVKAKVTKEEFLKTRLGKFETFVVEPKFSVNGAWKQTGAIKIWLTKDKRKLPMRFDAKIKIGTVRGKIYSLK